MEIYWLKVAVPTMDGSVNTCVLPDGVGCPIARESAFDGALLGRIAVVLHHIVFDERVCGPAVDGEQTGTTTDGEGTAEGDGTRTTHKVG